MRMSQSRRGLHPVATALLAVALLAGCAGVKQENATPPAPSEAPGGATPAAQGPSQDAVKPLPGYRAANFTAVDVFTGEKVSLLDLRGQVVFLNFWATWCGPCRQEMPEMEALQQEMGKQVRIIALGGDAQESNEKMGAFAQSMGLTFTIASDQGAALGLYKVVGLPTSFFIDKEGIIVARHTGPMKLEKMKQYIAEAEKGAAKQ